MRLVFSIVYIAAMGILSHFIGEALPRRWFDPEKRPYAQLPFESNGMIYRALRVQAWKDRLPDMSKIMPDMVKKSISAAASSAEAGRVALETCVAEAVHWVLLLLSFPIYLICPDWAGALLAVLYGLSHIPFIIIQRYNRPTLVRLARRLKEREERIRHAHTDTDSQHG